MNRKVLFCLLVYIYALGNVAAFSQQKLKFSVASFEQDVFDMSAKDKQYEKIDGNGIRQPHFKMPKMHLRFFCAYKFEDSVVQDSNKYKKNVMI